jgi:hypothetical protein
MQEFLSHPKNILTKKKVFFVVECFFFQKKTLKVKRVLKTYNVYTHCSSKLTMIKKDFNKFILSQLVHSHPWLSFLVEDCHCGNIPKLNKQNIVSSNQIFSFFDIKNLVDFSKKIEKKITLGKKIQFFFFFFQKCEIASLVRVNF